jgi:hypothetical protein
MILKLISFKVSNAKRDNNNLVFIIIIQNLIEIFIQLILSN